MRPVPGRRGIGVIVGDGAGVLVGGIVAVGGMSVLVGANVGIDVGALVGGCDAAEAVIGLV